MLTIENLKEFGANVEEGVARCMGLNDFYLKLVNMAVPDQQIDALEAALAKKDLDAAFEIAHALKGMYGNISLTPIYKPLSEMTELLRSRTDTDYSALLAEAKKQKKKLEELAL
ncbi:Hpt domain-containing protein [bacterium]|nr:Hpt domain-containing protein [bacterium]